MSQDLCLTDPWTGNISNGCLEAMSPNALALTIARRACQRRARQAARLTPKARLHLTNLLAMSTERNLQNAQKYSLSGRRRDAGRAERDLARVQRFSRLAAELTADEADIQARAQQSREEQP